MLFGTGKRLSQTENKSLIVKHQYTTINQTNEYKYLGLFTFVSYGSTPLYLKESISIMERRAQRIIGGNAIIPCSENIKFRRICSFVHQCVHKNITDIFMNTLMHKRTNSDVFVRLCINVFIKMSVIFL